MKRLLIYTVLILLLVPARAQKRIIRPEPEIPVEVKQQFFPGYPDPFPADSIGKLKAVQFYESRIENLDGSESRENQLLILYCLSELNRLKGEYIRALYGLRDTYNAMNGTLDTLDRALLQSRICFNMAELAKLDRKTAYPGRLLRELGFDGFEPLMLNTIELLEKMEDEQDLLAMYTVAFDHYRESGQMAKAWAYGQDLITFKDKVAGMQLKRKLSSLQKELEMEQKDRELRLLESQRTLYGEKIKSTARQSWFIVGSILILVVLAVSLVHRFRIVRKTRDLLREKAAQLQHEKERARRNEVFKEQFLANVSHEIRTPMNAIMGITNILIKNRHLKPQEKYLSAMQESARNLLVLINDILDLSKLEAGKVELVHTPFNIRSLMEEIHAKLKGRAFDKSLSLRMEIGEDVPEILTGDAFVLSNILMSLVTNAITFTIRGGVEFVCKEGERSGDMQTLLFEVRDTGMGIIPEKQETILKTFVKVYEKNAIHYEGSGLELAIINQLVRLQGGNIRLESTSGVGTTFFLEIPYRLSEGAVVAEEEKPVPDESELKDIRVLLVEDNEFNVMVASTELESVIGGLQLDVAGNGEEALEMLQQNTYNLILMDVQMPVMDGYEATRRIRKMNGNVGRVPIIAMTANVLQQEIEKCMKEGMDDYISKPFDTNELLLKMKKLLMPAS